MARLIKCPRCQSQLDVTSVSGGATVRCSDCGAMVRVPTGSTGVRPAVPAETPAAPAARPGGRSTALFKKMAGTRAPGGSRPPSRTVAAVDDRRGGHAPRGRRGDNTAMIGLGIGGGIVVLIIIMIFAMQSKSQRIANEKEAKAKYKRDVEAHNAKVMEDFRREEAEIAAQEAAMKKAAKEGKKPALQKDASGAYKAPATFEPGAARWVKGGGDVTADPAVLKEFEALAASGKIAEIVGNPARYFDAMLVSFLSDNEAVARGAFQAIHDLCAAKGIQTDSGKNPVRLDLLNAAQWRGGEHSHWAEWWAKAQNKLAMGVNDPKLQEEIRTKGGPGDPSKADWDKLMGFLRAGGAFDDLTRPEGKSFQQVKDMGAAAYPYLAKYIDNEDPLLGRAAVVVLNLLTGRQGQMPTEATKAAVRAEWEAWIKKGE